MQSLEPENVQVPYGWAATVERVHGERGRLWLATLTALLLECHERWSLELDRPFQNLSYNLVIPGRDAEGADVVLKLGVPCGELQTEAAALNLFGGAGAVRLLDQDVEHGALLLERALPGAPLHVRREDGEATRTAARLMRRLWREPPASQPFPSLAVWFRAYERLRSHFGGGSGPFAADLIGRAEKTFSELNLSSGRAVILHGDLHHENILSSQRDGWLAIDPKGVCGDPGYELGSFMLNQLPQGAANSAIMEIFRRRLSIFSEELQIEQKRLAGWAFCHAVLSALWDFEESAEWGGAVRLAEILAELT